MKFKKDEVYLLERIHLISGVKKTDIQKVFESLFISVVLNYLNGEDMYIPYIGNCNFTYEGDKIVDGKPEAIVNCKFSLDKNLLKNIGQIEDGVDPEFIKMLKSKIYSMLGDYLNKEE